MIFPRTSTSHRALSFGCNPAVDDAKPRAPMSYAEMIAFVVDLHEGDVRDNRLASHVRDVGVDCVTNPMREWETLSDADMAAFRSEAHIAKSVSIKN